MNPVIIGNATLYLGDMLQIAPSLEKGDLCIADPPYGIGESSRKNATRGKPFGSRVDGKNTKGTFVPPVDYGVYEWDGKPASAEQIAAIIAAAPLSIIWGGNYFALPPRSKWLVWDKLNSGDFADAELAWTNFGGAVRVFRHMWNGMLRDSERGLPRVHPTQKPIALMAWCIEQCGLEPNSLIVDPFMGSASVGIAAHKAGHRYVGIEINEHYFQAACERIENAQRQARMFP